jgi:crotonobetainyl-CoA:carnitine CoA-transferase CaiB-like acyl-CoA transferase
MEQDQFFAGLKVVELASVLAGPAVGMFFAELGAEVLKIENKTTGGDITRKWKLPSENPDSPISAYFCSVNWGKKHLMADLRQPEERDQVLQLIAEADVVISNFRPTAARAFGMDMETLHALYPELICAQLQAFSDPEDETPAFDVVLQAEAGFLYMCGEPGCPPVKMPVALIDLLAAHQMKEAILLALLKKSRTGKGSIVRTSLMESALASLANQATNFLMSGYIPQPMGTQHPNIAPYGDCYLCADQQRVLLAVGTEKQFQNFCTAIQLQLVDDPRFASNPDRVKNRAALNQAIATRIREKNLDAWMDAFHANGVPAARIRDMQAVCKLETTQKMILKENISGTETRRIRSIAFTLQD